MTFFGDGQKANPKILDLESSASVVETVVLLYF